MADLREKSIETRLKRNATRLDCIIQKLNTNETGWPDRIVLLPTGLTAYVELKTVKGVLSPRQRLVKEQIKAMRAPYFIVFDKASEGIFLNWIKEQIEAYEL